MSAALYLSLASLLLAVGAIVYSEGRVREIREQARRETNGLGQKLTRVIEVLTPIIPADKLEEEMKYILSGNGAPGQIRTGTPRL